MDWNRRTKDDPVFASRAVSIACGDAGPCLDEAGLLPSGAGQALAIDVVKIKGGNTIAISHAVERQLPSAMIAGQQNYATDGLTRLEHAVRPDNSLQRQRLVSTA